MPTAPTLALIHSPLVGPLTWQPISALLQARGFSVIAPSLAGVFEAGPPYYPKLAARVSEALATSGPTVLVAHSGAGALLPSIAAAHRGSVAAAVYVDAILPHPGESWFQTAPAQLSEWLQQIAADGWLPSWDQWLPPRMLDTLLPYPDLRMRFVADLPRVPLAYFEEPAPPISDAIRRSAYLQLSQAYQDAADEAERRGWPTRREAADHLVLLTRPELVLEHLSWLIEHVTPGA